MSDSDKWGAVLDALSDSYRRQLLVALLHHNPQDDQDPDPLDVVDASENDIERLRTEIVHQHLPKLDDMGVIEWDRSTQKISRGPNWDDIAPLLQLIEDHKDELPDGWL